MRLTPEARLLLRIAALIVPAQNREEWAREWEGELWYWLTSVPEATVGARLQLARHCTGAIVDAFYLRVDAEELARNASRTAGHPLFPIAAALALLLLLGAWSGWWPRARQAIVGPNYPAADRIAILYQEGPGVRDRRSVPAEKVVDWDKKAASLEGAAVYYWYHTVLGLHPDEVRGAKVGPAFFQIVGVEPALGRLFTRSDAEYCQDCAVLSYDSWQRYLGGDRGAIGNKVIVDGQPMRVIGVLPRNFWFVEARPAVWTLYVAGETWRVWDVAPSGGVCRLRPGVTPAAAQAALRAAADPSMPRSSGKWATVTPIAQVARRSLPFVFPMFGVALIAAAILAALRGFRSAVFGVVTSALALAVAFLWIIEFTEPGQTFAIWAYIASSVGVVVYSYRDLRRRCPVCLHRLTMPVRIGHSGQVLLEQSGLELVCPQGHGMLYTPQVQVEAASWVRV